MKTSDRPALSLVWRACHETLPPLDECQRAILDGWGGPVLALGGPGTGKTTLVAHAALRVLGRGGRPLVFARTRAAASALRNLITVGLSGAVWQPTVTTVYGFCRAVFRRFAGGPEGPEGAEWRLLTAPEQEFRVRELLGGHPELWPAPLRPATATVGFARQVRAALARARQLGLDPADVEAMGEQAGRSEWVAMGRFFGEYLDVLDAEQVLDYAELVHRTRILLAVDEVAQAARREADAVVVDDYPELDPAQVGVLAALAPPGGMLLAAGDPQTVLSGFRGAHPRAVAGFTEVFGGGRVVELGQGHRQGPVLAGALSGVSARLAVPVAGGQAIRLAAAPAERGGQVGAVVCRSEASQWQAIVDELRRARLDDGLAYDEMAVLVRAGQRLVGPVVRALTRAGVPVRVAAGDVALAEARPVRTLLTALEAAARGRVGEAEAAGLLTSPLASGAGEPALDALGLRRVVRAHRALAGPPGEVVSGEVVAEDGLPADASPAEALSEEPLSEDARLAAAINEPSWCGRAAGTPWESVAAPVARLAGLLARAHTALERGRAADEVAWGLWHGSGWPDALDRETIAGGPLGARAVSDLAALSAFFTFAGECEARGGAAGVRMLVAEVEAQQIPADHEREARVGRGVEVMTVHRAKGRQWPLVIVAGASEGAWPTSRRAAGVLDPDELRSDGLARVAGGSGAHLAAERRLFYAACATAQRRLVVTCVDSGTDDGGSPSRFVAELGVEAQRWRPAREALALGPMVAGLRREAVDAGVSQARRWAAASVLAELARARDERGRPVAPGADPSSWWGVLPLSGEGAGGGGPAGATLSPSQVTGLLECPRRYFLAREVRADVSSSQAATLGLVVHTLVQHAQTDGWSRDRLLERLDELWAEQAPGGVGWVSQALRDEAARAVDRFLAWQRTRRGEVAGVEAPFRFGLDVDGFPLTIVGTVDRLERMPDGRLRVIDFKTSATPYSQTRTDGLEQLGVYQLAVDGGAFGEGESAGGMLVFLRAGGDLPTTREQDSLRIHPFLGDDPGELAYPTWVHHRLAQAAALIRDGEYPATPGAQCRSCPFANSCPASGQGGQVVP